MAENSDKNPGKNPAANSPHAVIAAALRRERERAGLTISELARRAGLAKSTLSQLESATSNPSVETLWTLASALGLPFSQLVTTPPPQVRVIRAGSGPRIGSQNTDFMGTLLATGSRHAQRDLYLIELGADAVRQAEPHLPGSIEHLVLAAGRLRAGPVDRLVDLEPGDYLAFAGDVHHRYEALAPDTWAMLIMEHP